MLRLIGLLSLTICGCGGDAGQEGSCPSLVPQDPAEKCDPTPEYGGTVHHCNECGGDTTCISGTLSGQEAAFGGVESVDGRAVCTRTCTTVADCATLDYLRANADVDASRTSQQWACTSLGGIGYCSVAVTAAGGSTNACDNCVQACRGEDHCCTGCGCICQDACGGTC